MNIFAILQKRILVLFFWIFAFLYCFSVDIIASLLISFYIAIGTKIALQYLPTFFLRRKNPTHFILNERKISDEAEQLNAVAELLHFPHTIAKVSSWFTISAIFVMTLPVFKLSFLAGLIVFSGLILYAISNIKMLATEQSINFLNKYFMESLYKLKCNVPYQSKIFKSTPILFLFFPLVFFSEYITLLKLLIIHTISIVMYFSLDNYFSEINGLIDRANYNLLTLKKMGSLCHDLTNPLWLANTALQEMKKNPSLFQNEELQGVLSDSLERSLKMIKERKYF